MPVINSGDTAFILICTALVCMMTPALALFYGGLVKQRNVLSIMMQNFICMGVVGVIWVFGGFSLVFGPSVGGVIGDIGTYFGMYHVGIRPNPEFADNIPFIMIFAYQMMFAIITPALMTGSFVGRFRFTAYLLFVAFWTILVYLPVAHWIWGGGFLARLGVVDFAGGIVIHASAGFSALVAARFLGASARVQGEKKEQPASLPLVAVGAGLLWFGWFGFNAGGAYAADALAAYAFTNTMLAGAVAMLVWLAWEWLESGRPSFSGVLVGAVTGLATITPAAGYVEPTAALAIGAIGASVCFNAKYVQSWLKIDDTLEVWRAHGVGGVTGALLIGVLASSHINAVSAGWHQLGVQALALVIVAVYAIVITLILLKILDAAGILRVPAEEQIRGLDEEMHGETAFSLWNMKN
ncbi:ammonium transporter [Castellaniella sp.]|uniref:ammonium transporter n=1 Tax=Castellaniella sp. TaxID=1955812 RepID=UPI00356089DA